MKESRVERLSRSMPYKEIADMLEKELNEANSKIEEMELQAQADMAFEEYLEDKRNSEEN